MGNFQSVQFGATPAGGNSNNPRGHYHGHNPRPFVSQDDMQAHMKDQRYSGTYDQQEKSFQDFVEQCLSLTDRRLLGGAGQNGVLERAMGQQGPRDYQDPHNTLGAMTDVYRDMEEARRDQASPLYKTSAFERQRVAEKINRSVPDEAVLSGSERYNGAVKVGHLDPAAGEDSEIGFVSGDGQTWSE